jgi:5-methylcytosine-specific restriction endonuclease McrA
MATSLKLQAHLVRLHAFNKKEPGHAAAWAVYTANEVGAKRRKLEFSISFDEFKELAKRPCSYCGVPPSNVTIRPSGPFVYSGMDRVNSKAGYTPENVVPCCSVCNVAKSAMTSEEFKAWIKRVYTNLYGD